MTKLCDFDLIAFQLVHSFCCVNENATVNNTGIKFACYKTWVCLGSNRIT